MGVERLEEEWHCGRVLDDRVLYCKQWDILIHVTGSASVSDRSERISHIGVFRNSAVRSIP
jgi:hypothetical protein